MSTGTEHPMMVSPPGGEENPLGPLGQESKPPAQELTAKAPGAHSATETSHEILAKAYDNQANQPSQANQPEQASQSQQSTQQATQQQATAYPPTASDSRMADDPPSVEHRHMPTDNAPFVPPRPPRETGSVLPVNPRDFISPSFRQLLSSKTLGTIVPQLGSIIIARSNESIASVFKKLIDYKILSVPLLNVETNQYVAFLDLLDLLAVLVDSLGLQQRSNWPLIEHWMAQVQFQAPCIQLVHKSQRNPWYVIASGQPLDVAIQQMAKYNVHRLAVSDLQNNFISVLTQSHIIQWLASHLNDSPNVGYGPLADLTVEELKLGYRPVITIREDKLALDAFLLIHQQGVSAVAVVDQHNRLFGIISVSDLKDIGYSANMLTKLFIPTGQFIRNKLEGAQHQYAYYVTRDDTVRQVLELMKRHKIHRVFVVNNAAERKLIGVVATNDILALFDIIPVSSD